MFAFHTCQQACQRRKQMPSGRKQVPNGRKQVRVGRKQKSPVRKGRLQIEGSEPNAAKLLLVRHFHLNIVIVIGGFVRGMNACWNVSRLIETCFPRLASVALQRPSAPDLRLILAWIKALGWYSRNQPLFLGLKFSRDLGKSC